MYAYIHTHTHVCRVIVIVSHRSDPLPEAGLCHHDLDLSPMLPTMNDWPCSYSVALRETLGSACALQILHTRFYTSM